MVSEQTPSPEKMKVVSFDEALKTLGAFGRYQRRVFLPMCLLVMSVGAQAIITVFTLDTPSFRCAIPEVANDSYSLSGREVPELLNLSIPWEKDDDGKPMRSECKLYQDRNRTETGDLLANRSTESCDTWVFDHSVMTKTFTEQAELVCDKKQYHALADMLFMAGVLVGSIVAGVLSDILGRKKALMMSLLVHVSCAIGIAFSPSYAVFATLRFLIGVGNMGVFLSAYILGLEMVGITMRTLAGSVIQAFWPLGLFILTGVAYGVRDWHHLQLAAACPAVLFFTYFFFVNESPRWLASKGRYDEANALLQHAAKVNGLPPPPPVGPTEDKQEDRKENPLLMFTNRTTLIRTLILFLNWVVVTMMYYGLSLNVGSLGGNIYLNFFLSSLAELLGYVLALLGLDRLGRKVMHCTSMILGGLACLATMFPVMFAGDSKDVLVLVLSNVGKLGASSAFSIIFLFSAELYPTVARNSLMGASSMVARVGGIASPYIAQLNVIVGGKLGVALPLVVFGGSGLLAGVLALLLPETLHKPLPMTIEDAINLGNRANREEKVES